MTIHWPQFIYLLIVVLGVGMSISDHGKPRSRENAWTSIIAAALMLGLLWWGGFFR